MTVSESRSLVAGARIEDVYDVVSPRADHLMESLRGAGYSLPAAVSDLIDAMRTGPCSFREDREAGDQGRFGLGLKTALISQTGLLTAAIRTASPRSPCIPQWDLDHRRRLFPVDTPASG